MPEWIVVWGLYLGVPLLVIVGLIVWLRKRGS